MTNEGRQLNFRYPNNKMIAYLEPHDIHRLSEEQQREMKENLDFDPNFWDSQFLRYVQVLDSDNKNFMILYSCQESAKYYDVEDGDQVELSHYDASENSTNLLHDFEDGQRHHDTYQTFKLREGVKAVPIFTEAVQILWRAGKALRPNSEIKEAPNDE